MNEALSHLRPWETGELLDRSATFWRRRAKPLFQVMLGFQLVLFVMQKAYVVLAQRYFPALMSVRAMTEAQASGSEEVLRQSAIGVAALAIIVPLWIFMSWAANLALGRFIIDDIVGRGGDIKGSLRRMRKRLGTLLGVFVVVHLWTFGVFLVSMIPGIAVIAAGVASGNPTALLGAFIGGYALIVLAWLLTTLWYFLRFLLVPTVVAVEERGVLATIKRSGELISGRVGPRFVDRVFVRATIVVTIIFVILLLVTLVMGIPAGILQVIFGNLLDPQNASPESVPQVLLIPAELFEAVGAALILPLSSVLAALFYLDMRMRREGLDLELKLNAAEAKQA